MDLQSLSHKLSSLQSELSEQEDVLKDMYQNLSENQGLHPFEKEEMRQEYQTYLNDYERAYDIANREYQSSIDGLSESYLSLCPFYKGTSLPKSSFLESPKDVADLYGLFLILGIAHMYGLQ